MCPRTGVVASVWLAVLCFGAPQPAVKPDAASFTEPSDDAWAERVPDLGEVRFNHDEKALAGILDETGAEVAKALGGGANATSSEAIDALSFIAAESRWVSFRATDRYVLEARLKEYRTAPGSDTPLDKPVRDGFLNTGNFIEPVALLLPQFRQQATFRLIGTGKVAGQEANIIAFRQSADAERRFFTGPNISSLRQGLFWIGAEKHEVLRAYVDLANPPADFPFSRFTMDEYIVPVEFPSGGAAWLPGRVTIDASAKDFEYHNVYRYSDFRTLADGNNAGMAGWQPPAGEDAREVLARGVGLEEAQSADAGSVLEQAVKLNPNRAEAHYYLATVLNANGDEARAESEVREAIRLNPQSAPMHTLLGVILYRRPDLTAAMAEFRGAIRLEPKDARAHFSLAQTLDKAGDTQAALAEYRTAESLAPSDPTIRAKLEQREAAAPTTGQSQASQPVIKVDVRQVVVPVVVTDRDGKHVGGLSRDDFTVLEDGVEQKITGFSVEDVALSETAATRQAATATPGSASSAPAGLPASGPVRRTYVICLDAWHTGPQSLAAARKALLKLFRSEQAADAQYALIALGTTMQVLQNPTRDPQAVLRALDDDSFRKTLNGSPVAWAYELKNFEDQLNAVSKVCGDMDPSVPGNSSHSKDPSEAPCQSQKLRLANQVESFADEQRTSEKGFLAELRSVIEQLAKTNDRRTVILISDGFSMSPGHEIYELASAYLPTFPELTLNAGTLEDTDLDIVQQVAQKSNIPIYTIDSRGLYADKTLDASREGISRVAMGRVTAAWQSIQAEDGQTLSEIAAATGGVSFQNDNDLSPGLERAFADGRDYYTLAYVPTNKTLDGKFRKIAVRLRDTRLQANFKRGYWADKQPAAN